MPFMRRPDRWAPETRPRRYDRPRVLVEHPDHGAAFAMEQLLERRGYDVAVCGGPGRLRGGDCPLVEHGRCHLVESADVVVHCLSPDHAGERPVLHALRRIRPDMPVVVEAPAPSVERHRELLEGCTMVPFPVRSAALEDAVRAATASV